RRAAAGPPPRNLRRPRAGGAGSVTDGGISVKAYMSRVAIAVALLALLPLRVPAQEKDRADDYRKYFKKPTNPAQFWEAMKFEMEVGRFDLAAQLLREMLKKGPTEDELIKLHDKKGITPFLRLRLARRWEK